jgi:predicted ATPase
MNEAFLKSVELLEGHTARERAGYPWQLPAIAQLADGLALDPHVTYLIGENGTGKSTLLEAIAIVAGMQAEGGSSNFNFATRDESPDLAKGFSFSDRDSHSELSQAIRVVRGIRRPKTDFFLRAESLFAATTYLEQLDHNPLASYGGRSLHEQSHGESFLAILIHRFGPHGLYLLDEPEAALSTQNCLTCLRRIHELVLTGSQFIISTHSPIILAYPNATIYSCTDSGLETVSYNDAEPVRLTRSFLSAPGRFLHELFDDDQFTLTPELD